ncbi:MAG: serine--tRNA ligase [Coriobacteriia bacterium]|nr:serine--tRNA ligase [Coriobacteriia bacterium]
MLDAKFIRDNPQVVAKAMQSRKDNWDVDTFMVLDEKRRKAIVKVEALQAQRNEASKSIGALMAQGKGDKAEIAKKAVRDINEEIGERENAMKRLEEETQRYLSLAPNIADESVPIGTDENDNVEVRRIGTPPTFDFEPQPHWDLGPALGIIDFDRGVKLAESKFVVLAGDGARLERALINFMLEEHHKIGFKEWAPPSLVNSESLFATGNLPKFADDLYRITDHDLYLIPTAEVPLTNLHRGEVLEGERLPLHYCAFSQCFREEAGSAGRDTRGMIRVHQFDKVEMVKFATPETSMDELESMTRQAEHILEELGLAYRTIVLCTGDMGFASAKTYDIEVWLPSYDDYKEISSCSNCRDFQTRRANIKYRDPAEFKGSRIVHSLNGSGLAVGRTLAAVIENYQQADGSVLIPEVLRPFMGGQERIVAPE